jgi:hypothetical protein
MQGLSFRPSEFPFPDPSPAFTLRSIPGLERWHDAMDIGTLYQNDSLTTPISANAQPVGGWQNKSGHAGRQLTQGASGSRPTFRTGYINGRPAVESDGFDDFLRTSSGVVFNQPTTIAFVGKLAIATGFTQTWCDAQSSLSDRQRVYLGTSGGRRLNAGIDVGTSSTADTLPHVHLLVFDGLNSLYNVDGSDIWSGDAGSQALEGLTLLGNRAGGQILNGGIGEFALYSRRLTAGERAQVVAHLRSKWGI